MRFAAEQTSLWASAAFEAGPGAASRWIRLYRFRDGLVVSGRSYENHAEALEAAGPSE
jgi:ketosteroid isomerase-like protein